MISIEKYGKEDQLPGDFQREQVIDFLYNHLDQFGDTKSAIGKCLDYAFSDAEGKGGFVLIGRKEEKPVGVVIVNDTGMSEYIPDYFLVYIAVDGTERNQGIGQQLMERTFDECKDGDLALHVEYDNPAKRLYERTGFTNKYAEMRRARS
ncbi:MAG: GNAT family N-acetyltransferase [Ectothiorhodospiraceae bacterium]|nr:GNAT family N-acetyltransferase [Ectothiorhodospiraceae bacterium]